MRLLWKPSPEQWRTASTALPRPWAQAPLYHPSGYGSISRKKKKKNALLFGYIYRPTERTMLLISSQMHLTQGIGSTFRPNLPKRYRLPGGSVVKNPPVIAGDMGLIHGLERSLREGNGNPLQYSCLGNPMEPKRLQSMGSQKSQTRLRDSTTTNNTQKIYKNQEWLGLYLKFRSKEFEQAKVHHKSSILIWQWLEAKV